MTSDLQRAQLLESLMHTLKRMARSRKNRGAQITLQTTEIVHETYLRLAKQYALDWGNRDEFLIAFASTLRRFMVDHYRRRWADKRGGKQSDLSLDDLEIEIPVPDGLPDWIALDEKMIELESIDPVARQVLELRYFAGLSREETARAVNFTPRTVTRKLNFARSYLRTQFSEPQDH